MRDRKVTFPLLAAIYLPALIILAFVAFVTVQWRLDPGFLFREPAQTLDVSPLVGVISNIGVLAWATAAGVCIFSGTVLTRSGRDEAVASFLIWSGVLTSALLLDDFFMLHDYMAKVYFHIDEKVILAGEGLFLVWVLVKFRSIIVESAYPLLLLALGFFFLSNVVDIFLTGHWHSPWRIYSEDGFKFLGIVSWCAYFTRTSFQRLTPLLTARRSTNPHKMEC